MAPESDGASRRETGKKSLEREKLMMVFFEIFPTAKAVGFLGTNVTLLINTASCIHLANFICLQRNCRTFWRLRVVSTLQNVSAYSKLLPKGGIQAGCIHLAKRVRLQQSSCKVLNVSGLQVVVEWKIPSA